MRGEVLRIDSKGFLKLDDRFLEKLLLGGRITAFHFRALDISLAQFINHLIIHAEIKATPIEFGIVVFEDTAEFRDGFVQKTILLVYQAIKPRDGPSRRWRVAT